MKFEKQKKQTAKELDERKIGDSERTKKELKPDHLLSNSNDILSERGAPKIEIVSFNVFFFVWALPATNSCFFLDYRIHTLSLPRDKNHPASRAILYNEDTYRCS